MITKVLICHYPKVFHSLTFMICEASITSELTIGTFTIYPGLFTEFENFLTGIILIFLFHFIHIFL